MHASSTQPGDDFPVMRFLEKSLDGGSGDWPDIRNLLQLGHIGGQQRFQRAEMGGQRSGGRFANFADSQCIQKAGQGSGLAMRQRLDQILLVYNRNSKFSEGNLL